MSSAFSSVASGETTASSFTNTESGAIVYSLRADEVIGSPPKELLRLVEEADSPPNSIRVVESSWSNTKEKRYSELAALRALGAATPEDLKEFRNLLDLRRQAKSPIPPEEAIFQFKRRRMEAEILASLTKYVAFLEAPSDPKA